MNLQKRSKWVKKLVLPAVVIVAMGFFMSGCNTTDEADTSALATKVSSVNDQDLADLKYEGEPYVEVNKGEPEFSEDMKDEKSFESYGKLDKLGRCTGAIANLSEDTLPDEDEERGNISSVHPTGWMSDQGWERCHLIAWCLSGENANEENLVTGTHYMNVTGMLPFELEVVRYIERTGHHVLYSVDPIFEGNNLIPSGVHMEGESVEDDEISFNVYCFNVNPGKEIDYVSGEVSDPKVTSTKSNSSDKHVYVLNTNSYKFHLPTCSSVSSMSERNKEVVKCNRQELIDKGYSPCYNCEP